MDNNIEQPYDINASLYGKHPPTITEEQEDSDEEVERMHTLNDSSSSSSSDDSPKSETHEFDELNQ